MAVLSRVLLAVFAQGACREWIWVLITSQDFCFHNASSGTRKGSCDCLSLAICLIKALVSLCICDSTHGIWNQNSPFHWRGGCIAVILLPINCEKTVTQTN